MDIDKDAKRISKIALLLPLYFSQGLPYGFQATALSAYLRTQHVNLETIGFLGALSLPWVLKALWAPLAERYYSPKFGKRKSWIVPLQTLMILSFIVASFIPAQEHFIAFLSSVFVMNLFGATQDIAVDGLAIDLLKNEELGIGNSAQVAGYKVGMIMGGGILVWLSSFFGWEGMFILMAICATVPLIIICFYHEPETTENGAVVVALDWKEILQKIKGIFTVRGTYWLIAFVLTYKFGESMIDVMFKPFLVDIGYITARIGLLVGTYGMIASLLGSVLGGVLSSKINFWKALGIAALFRTFPLIMEWYLAYGNPSDTLIVVTMIAEHFFGGILTTTMFAYMMSQIDRNIGTTHYTLLSSFELIGKSIAGGASGFLASFYGYANLFALGVGLSLITLFLLFKINRQPLKV